MADVSVPTVRFARWIDNFVASHGPTSLDVAAGMLRGRAADESHFEARPPFDQSYAGKADVADFLASIHAPVCWGVILVRKGGFAIARLDGGVLAEHKVGRRHVQGRTKAGGQSQQRFARRRDNQARAAYDAATADAVRLLGGRAIAVVAGGDRVAVDTVLRAPELATLTVVGPWLATSDPRRRELDGAIEEARAVRVSVTNAA